MDKETFNGHDGLLRWNDGNSNNQPGLSTTGTQENEQVTESTSEVNRSNKRLDLYLFHFSSKL